MATSHETTAGRHDRAKPTDINTTPSVRFCHLPPDILYRIASKLPPKEFARTSVLSTEWRGCMTSTCPRLTFDFAAMCKCKMEDLQHRHVWQFLSEVNDILWKHNDKVVETLEVKIGFVSIEVAHLIDAFVDFAATSRTKNLILDLRPERFWWECKDLYVFPFQLFDRASISHLQHMRLNFVSLDPPSWFKGFPNLRKLHLEMVHVSRKDLENMLSHCYTLEWFYIHKCHLDDALVVDSPLPRLLYLRIDWCKLTMIKFNAVNLATFDYVGSFIPIDLAHSFKLQSANIAFGSTNFQYMLTSLLNGLSSVQSLTLGIGVPYLEKPRSWDNPLKFSNLRHLQLVMFIGYEHVDKILYSVLFLRSTPFIEKLEVHFAGPRLWFAEVGPCRKDLGQCKYNYLKDVWITGFKAARGQLEFLMLVVENAPALEVVLVEIGEYPPYLYDTTELCSIEKAKKIARTCLSTVLPQNVKFDVKE